MADIQEPNEIQEIIDNMERFNTSTPIIEGDLPDPPPIGFTRTKHFLIEIKGKSYLAYVQLVRFFAKNTHLHLRNYYIGREKRLHLFSIEEGLTGDTVRSHTYGSKEIPAHYEEENDGWGSNQEIMPHLPKMVDPDHFSSQRLSDEAILSANAEILDLILRGVFESTYPVTRNVTVNELLAVVNPIALMTRADHKIFKESMDNIDFETALQVLTYVKDTIDTEAFLSPEILLVVTQDVALGKKQFKLYQRIAKAYLGYFHAISSLTRALSGGFAIEFDVDTQYKAIYRWILAALEDDIESKPLAGSKLDDNDLTIHDYFRCNPNGTIKYDPLMAMLLCENENTPLTWQCVKRGLEFTSRLYLAIMIS